MKTLYPLLVVLLLATLPSCYCWKPENSKQPQCVAALVTVDCTKNSAIEQAPNVLPLVKWILSGAPGGQMDWQTLLKSLMHFGFDVVGCTAEQLDNAFALKATKMSKSTPDAMQSSEAAYLAVKKESDGIHDRWKAFLAKEYPTVRFKLPAKNPLEAAVQ